MAAVAIYAAMDGQTLNEEDKKMTGGPECSGQLGVLSEDDVKRVKADITSAMKYIKPYNGPSRIWFKYQASLMEGTNRLADIVSKMPVSKQTADVLVNLLLRLDKKLCAGGVDDSDGTVGGFMEGTVEVLRKFAELDPECIKSFKKLANRDTCFGWEESLVEILDESR